MQETLPALSAVDIVAILLIGVGCIQGGFRGLSGELARLAGVVLAFIAGTLLHEPAAAWISANTRLEPQPANLLAFATAVVGALIVLNLARKLLEKMIKLVFEDGFDRVAGVIAGGLRMAVLVCIGFIALNMLPGDHPQFGEESWFGRNMIRYVPTVRQTLIDAGVPGIAPHDDPDTPSTKEAPDVS